MPSVFVTRAIPGPALDILIDAYGKDSVEMYPEDQIIPRDQFLETIKGRDAVLTMLTEAWDADAFDAAQGLKVLANCAVGYNNINTDEATKHSVIATNTPDVLTETTADLAWALMMGAARRLGEAEVYLREGKWNAWAPDLLLGNDIYRKTLGIFGMGRIGMAVARRAAGFNMKVIYNKRTQLSSEEEAEIGATYVSFDELLEQSDHLSIHCPMSPETQGIFGAAAFKKMKDSATLVNTSRGPIVQEEALAQALENGDIAFAGIDVFEKEPEIHSALLKAPNAFLVPHIGSATLETRTAMASLAANNIVAVLDGKDAITPIN